LRPLRAAHMISYLQAVVIGLLQGVTELFPVSSLGHSVLVPAFIGGSWATLVTQSATQTSESSPYLAIIVALHVATALALIVFFRSDWMRPADANRGGGDDQQPGESFVGVGGDDAARGDGGPKIQAVVGVQAGVGMGPVGAGMGQRESVGEVVAGLDVRAGRRGAVHVVA
jgi:hypothetical protein